MLEFQPPSAHYIHDLDVICFHGVDKGRVLCFTISSETLESISGEHFERDPMPLFEKWRPVVFSAARRQYEVNVINSSKIFTVRAAYQEEN